MLALSFSSRFKEHRKDFLISKIPPFGVSKGNKAQVLSTHIDHDSAHLIVKYLSSKRPFFNSFNYYLKDIINVLSEQSTQVRRRHKKKDSSKGKILLGT